MNSIKLIATDLDGTLIGNESEFEHYNRLSSLIHSYRERFGTIWVICSGRSNRSLDLLVEDLGSMGLEPDYVLAKGSRFFVNRFSRLRSKRGWNWNIRMQMFLSRFYVRGTLREWDRDVDIRFKSVSTLFEGRNRLCLRFRNRGEADAAVALLRRKSQVFRHLKVSQYMSEVDVRTVTFTKGMAVEFLAGQLGVKRSETLCIGNGFSDISMLDGMVSAHTGCPINSEMEVIDQVHRTGGFIARGSGMQGVVEILDGYLRNEICNDLPDWWTTVRAPRYPRDARQHRHHHKHHHHARMPGERYSFPILVLAGFAAVVVFANFGLLPFSRLIMLPFRIFGAVMERLMNAVFY